MNRFSLFHETKTSVLEESKSTKEQDRTLFIARFNSFDLEDLSMAYSLVNSSSFVLFDRELVDT